MRTPRTPVSPRPLRGAVVALLVTAMAVIAGAVPAHADPTPAEIEKQIDERWNELEPLIEEHNATKIKLASQQKKADELAAKIEPLEQEVRFTRGRVGYYAGYIYRGGRASAVNSMLNSSDPTVFVERMVTLNLVAREQNAAIADVLEAKAKLDEVKKPLDDLIKQLTAVEKQQSERAATIDAEIDKLNDLRLAAYGSQAGTGELAPVACPQVYPGGALGKVVNFACQQIGKPYIWGAAGPSAFDCSGLTMVAWQQAGVYLPHNARAQRSATKSVSRADLQPGDLVFYYSDLHHVGIYVGNGWVVHASQAGVPIKMRRVDGAPINSYGRP